MRHLKLYRWVAVLTLAIALVPRTASAQAADTLSISGTFQVDALQGTVGADLAEVYTHGSAHGWTLTLSGVTFAHEYYYVEWNDEWSSGHQEEYITRVHATSFDFEFFGPDADVLNKVVSQQLIKGGLSEDAFLYLKYLDYYDSADWEISRPYGGWYLRLSPLDPNAGVSFSANDWWTLLLFSADDDGYPLVEPQRLTSEQTVIADYRPGNSGSLESYGDAVWIGSAGPPLPPPPPTLSIVDGSVREGNKGTTRLDLTVTLSRISNEVVTVKYATANGTAFATSDYKATNGTLTFQPGQTSRTIAISIITDRKREPNETFTVQLSNAVGATINDAFATATILNDD